LLLRRKRGRGLLGGGGWGWGARGKEEVCMCEFGENAGREGTRRERHGERDTEREERERESFIEAVNRLGLIRHNILGRT
jgi:hypothetical protein